MIVYCGTGKRAAAATRVLQSKGYSAVYDAGAYKDLGYLKSLEGKEARGA